MANERIFLGLYSGGAADGIDAAAISVHGQGESMAVSQIAHINKLYPETMRREILALNGGHEQPANALGKLDRDIAIAAAATAKMIIEEAKLKSDDIEAVGWSGQAVGFEPAGKSNRLGASLELGSAAIIASRLARPVVSSFAAGDFAAGGCGGAISAWPEWLVFRDDRLSRAVVHLGGIAALTFIPTDADLVDVVSFDVGPGTIVIDELVHKFHNRRFDMDGSIAAGGRINPALLNELMANQYFHTDPPKRANLADWSQKYIWQMLQMAQKHDCSGADLISTAAELTARTIVQAISALTERPHEIILTGGGAMNIHLAGRIRTLLSPCSTYTVEKYGYGIRAQQAICYAILAAARLDAISAHCPAATGAEKPTTLGTVTLP